MSSSEDLLTTVLLQASASMGMPAKLMPLVEHYLHTLPNGPATNASDSSDLSHFEGSARSGCNDAFSVFAFLAFLLALLSTMMGGGGGGRRKRDLCQETNDPGEMQEATLACYSMLRGFLNAIDATDAKCSAFFMCEASAEAARLGPVGRAVAVASGPNASAWLQTSDAELHAQANEAVFNGGRENANCQQAFPCSSRPASYRFPSHSRTHEEASLDIDVDSLNYLQSFVERIASNQLAAK